MYYKIFFTKLVIFLLVEPYLLVKRQSRCSRRWCCCCGAGCSSVFGSADHESPSSLPLAPPNHWKIRWMNSSSYAVPMSQANTGSWSHGWSSETASPLDRSHDDRSNWNLILSQVLVMQWLIHQLLHKGNPRSCPRPQLVCRKIKVVNS